VRRLFSRLASSTAATSTVNLGPATSLRLRKIEAPRRHAGKGFKRIYTSFMGSLPNEPKRLRRGPVPNINFQAIE
jgi:hypothetical protein